VKKFAEPPALEVTSVPAEFTSEEDQVVIAGQTSNGAILTVNSEPIFVSPDGEFNQKVQHNPGINEIVLQARNRADKVSRETIKVLYNQNLAKVQLPVTKE